MNATINSVKVTANGFCLSFHRTDENDNKCINFSEDKYLHSAIGRANRYINMIVLRHPNIAVNDISAFIAGAFAEIEPYQGDNGQEYYRLNSIQLDDINMIMFKELL